MASSCIRDKCNEFVNNFRDSITDIPMGRLSHDKSWKESDEVLTKISKDILEILRDIWKNPAFSPKFSKSQSERTYMTHVIVPMICASSKGLSIGKSGFISTAECQSMASKDQRGIGKRPDVMFITTTPMPASTPISPPVDQIIYKKLEKAILALNNEINKMCTEAKWRSGAQIGG
ncbi:11596_t:CDS:2 [Entrophospora sp. SA101]|nr:11596_t:CDS:2 [Entrophospora sp. SA101]